ncbi:hypothetical protein [Spirosoma pollinicola]|uniref:Uncharacterized protein n=1 Tax=Spirosoma pollinicola TaxID=2057025 RepID=A0A2K8Z2G5_9BACT|nr:hypothetical protein [Spirosoma pollinicola]AUD04041.1 hypothetical protein CWM47_20735 [Spirosoma pollinicola]
MPYSNPDVLKHVENGKYYYVEHSDYDNTNVYGEVNQSDVQSIIDSNKAIIEYEYFYLKKWEIELNLEDFYATVFEYEQKVKKLTSFEEIYNFSKEEIHVNINRKFISYINSARIYIDHMDARLKHKYGQNSIQYMKFESAKRYCYDTYFSYRFFNQLRNYAEHSDSPITQIVLSGEPEKDGKLKKGSTSVYFEFDKKKLLEDAGIRKKLLVDMKRRNDFFPILPQVEEFKKPIKYLIDMLLIIEKEYYLLNCKTIEDFYNSRKQGGAPEITKFIFGPTKQTLIYSSTNIRLDLVKKIDKELSKLK